MKLFNFSTKASAHFAKAQVHGTNASKHLASAGVSFAKAAGYGAVIAGSLYAGYSMFVSVSSKVMIAKVADTFTPKAWVNYSAATMMADSAINFSYDTLTKYPASCFAAVEALAVCASEMASSTVSGFASNSYGTVKEFAGAGYEASMAAYDLGLGVSELLSGAIGEEVQHESDADFDSVVPVGDVTV